MDLEIHKYNLTLIHCVLFQQVNKRVLGEVFWFTLDRINYWFSPVEFGMIMRLKFSNEMDTSDYVTSGVTKLGERYLPNAKHLSYSDIHKAFKEKTWRNNDEDTVKINVLDFLHYRLMRSDNKKVISKSIFGLVDDWDTFNRYS